VAVLLEEHPGEGARPGEAVVGQVRGALGEVAEDRVRLGEVAAVLELDQRDAAVGVPGQELGAPGLRGVGQDVELGDLDRLAQLGQEERVLVCV
jgi:hypothetical protein